MAGKKPVNPRGQPTDSAPDDSLSVLFPDRQLTVGGVEVTVRELSFSEQLCATTIYSRRLATAWPLSPRRRWTARSRSTSSSTPWPCTLTATCAS
ncbi:DUF6631 family protein [Pseudomonas aeruginosa]|uniref:DUF6631 family protein n=1 Tax=Pseudomonas aeruginosa TaxID=287 RepID=UPI003AADF172